MLKLVLPNKKYKSGFYSYLDELEKEGLIKSSDVKIVKSIKIDKYIKDLNNLSSTLSRPKSYTPKTEYWLVDDGALIGNIIIRHKLNKRLTMVDGHIGYAIRASRRGKGLGKEILRLGILKAKKMNIKKILLTCDEKNISSIKIIEANGGKFQNKYKDNITKATYNRYWIKI